MVTQNLQINYQVIGDQGAVRWLTAKLDDLSSVLQFHTDEGEN